MTGAIRFAGDLPHLVTHRRMLRCGLEVIVHADHAVPQVCVSVWYRVGSSDERSDRTGSAHLFEHLFKRPPAALGGLHHYDVLKRAGSSVGAFYARFTDKDALLVTLHERACEQTITLADELLDPAGCIAAEPALKNVQGKFLGGLSSMNAGQLGVYANIDPTLRELVEDVVLDRE